MKYIPVDKLIAEIEKRQEERQDKRDSAYLENEYWPESDFCTRDKEDESIIAIVKSLQQEQSSNMIQWTGNNLKEVIDFTGKSQRFDEWFKSWEDFENYVHSHGDILKLFCEDGSHYEVPVGAWIVKTPDGYNLPSVAKYIQKNMGEVSDGYHTFNELYYYRMLYNAAFFNLLPKCWVHKSKRHHTGEECFGGGWFIVMANLPTGQISNHYELKDWDLFQVAEKEFADEWDGHTPQEAADRLRKYLQQGQPEVDLEKDIRTFTAEKLLLPIIGKQSEPMDITEGDWVACAYHFYELGKNARKEE